MQRLSFLLTAALLLALAPAYGQAPTAPAISVTIDGRAIVFNGTQPQEIGDAVMVPLRGVFQQMDATVAYDQATHTIKAQAGATTISLPIGSSTATVNGQTETLTQPAVVIDGATLVPLRFVAESMGAYVEWNAATHAVKIITPSAHLSTLPAPPASLGSIFIGQLTGIYTNTTPQQITLRVGAGEETAISMAFSPYVGVWLRSSSSPSGGISLGSDNNLDYLKIGDQVRVTRDTQGFATHIVGVYGLVTGVVKSITANKDGSHTVTLADGIIVQLIPDAPVAMAGRHVGIDEVMAAEHVVINADQDNKTGYGMAVVTAGDPLPTPPGQAPPIINLQIPPTSQPAPHSQSLPNRPRVWLAADQAPPPPQPEVVVAVTVKSFTADVAGPVKAGDAVHVTLKGSPGGKASAAIPNVLSDIPLPEVSPGDYEGSLIVPKGVSVSGAAIVARLIGSDGTPAPLMPAAQTVTIGNTPPMIFNQTPATGATVAMARPVIYASLYAGGGVNTSSVRILLDGTDVTSAAQVTPAFVAYRPATPLGNGSHTVAVVATDLLGNPARVEWRFRISGSDQDPLQEPDTGSQPISGSHPLDLTLHGWPGGTATFTVGTVLAQFPMREVAAGVYQGTYSPTPGASSQAAPVVAQVKPASGDPVFVTLGSLVAVSAPGPGEPTILRPGDGEQIEDTFSVEGGAPPGLIVLVTVGYKSRGATGLFEIDGNAATLAARADQKGRWKTDNLTLKAPWLLTADRVTRFTISARSVDSAGQESEVDTAEVMHS